MVVAVGKQLHRRALAVRVGEHPQFVLVGPGGFVGRRGTGSMQVLGGGFRHSFLQQQGDGLELRVGFEAPLHGLVQQQPCQGQQAHALVVGHERLHHGMVLAPGQARLGVVHGFIEAEAALQAQLGQALQVLAGCLGRHHQRQDAGVGRHHPFRAEATLEPQPRHAERPILVVELAVEGVVARLGHAPGQAQLLAVLDLQGHGGVAGLVQQGALVTGHHQHRHQVFEHRTGPGQQHRGTGAAGEQAAEGEPAFLGQLPLGDGDKMGQAHFRGQEVVVAGIQAVLVGVVADHQQMAPGVVEEAEIHLRHAGHLLQQLVHRGAAFQRQFP